MWEEKKIKNLILFSYPFHYLWLVLKICFYGFLILSFIKIKWSILITVIIIIIGHLLCFDLFLYENFYKSLNCNHALTGWKSKINRHWNLYISVLKVRPEIHYSLNKCISNISLGYFEIYLYRFELLYLLYIRYPNLSMFSQSQHVIPAFKGS